MNKEINMHHWCEHPEGTGLTNFKPEMLEVYEDAIKEYGKDDIVIAKSPLTGTPERASHYYSLHKLNFKGASEFWKVFRELNNIEEEINK